MNKKIFGIILIPSIFLFLIFSFIPKNAFTEKFKEIQPDIGNIKSVVTTTGTIKPQNRLEIKPTLSGRIEEILVKEGQKVKAGDVLALMSSTERAALLDAAKLKGDKEVEYWKNVYKAIPLVAPIDGEVIVRSVEPGQTVTTSDAIIVLSDRLIIKADVDETDIGEVNIDQKAVIGLDAYSDVKVEAVVDHIAYESTLVNNVTIYEVDILPINIPNIFRSGMSANVEIIVENKQNVITLPANAVINENGINYVLIKGSKPGDLIKKEVTIGIQNNEKVEVLSGLTKDDYIAIEDQEIVKPKTNTSKNPFMPTRGRRR